MSILATTPQKDNEKWEENLELQESAEQPVNVVAKSSRNSAQKVSHTLSAWLQKPKTVKRTRKKGKSSVIGCLIQKHTGPVYFTIRNDGKSRMKNNSYVELLNKFGKNFHKWHVPHYVINQHDAGDLKLKVSASLHTDNGRTLIYLDADCHDGVGNPEHARLLLDTFRQKHFPSMPPPVITERGGSAWLLVNTRTEYRNSFFKQPSPESYNAVIERLQDYLQSLAAHLNLDLSGVEVKGKVYAPNVIGHCVVSVKAGDMWKVPDRVEWFEQPVVPFSRLESSEFDVLPETQLSLSLPDTTADETEDYTATSFTPELVTQRILDRIPALCEWIEREFSDRPLKAGKFGLNTRQFAELMLSMYLLKPNVDGSNPVARFESFIKVLYEKGVFEYAWNHYRFKEVRDYLSSKGCILWRDNSYDFGTKKACKWRLVLEIENKMDALFAAETQLSLSLTDTNLAVDWTRCDGDDLRPMFKPQIDDMSSLHAVVDRVISIWTPENLISIAA